MTIVMISHASDDEALLSRAQQLEWIVDPQSGSLCRGYFRESASFYTALPALGEQTVITSDNVSLSQTGTSVLEKVAITQGSQQVTANKAYLIRDSKSQKITTVKAYGNIKIREPGKLLVAKQATLHLQNKSGVIHDALYHFSNTPITTRQSRLPDQTAWGTAKVIEQIKPNLLRMLQATYTTCAPVTEQWYLQAKQIELDREAGRGTVYNSFMYWDKLPIFYIPYANFPIDDRRKSGFLFPTINYSKESGSYLALPLYLNLAPNLDATMTTRYFDQRGVMEHGIARYITATSQGSVQAGILPNDRKFKNFKQNIAIEFARAPANLIARTLQQSDTRKMLSLHHAQNFNENWTALLDYNYVSDDYYFQDFSDSVENYGNLHNQLLRQGLLTYHDNNWDASILAQEFDTLHPLNLPFYYDQYSRLPQLSARREFADLFKNVNVDVAAQWVRFRFPNVSYWDYFSHRPFANGDRFTVTPSISIPMQSIAGYFIPSIQLVNRYYALASSQALTQAPMIASARSAQTITRSTPIFAADSGLTFERNISFLQHDYTQTLQPRLFYLYVPNQSQLEIPVFDSFKQQFTYEQMFRSNRFSGVDRIGDANQVALGIASRLLDANTGVEQANFAVGELFYFRDRKVTLCSYTDCIFTEDLFAKQRLSPLTSTLTLNIAPGWRIQSNFAYNFVERMTDNASIGLVYQPNPRRIIKASYTYATVAIPTNNFDLLYVPQYQFTLSGAWPLSSRVSALGIYNYNFVKGYSSSPQNFYYGIQYDSCCWATRMLAGRIFSGFTPNLHSKYDDRIYFQFVFKGLGTVGSSEASTVLASNIPEVSDIFR